MLEFPNICAWLADAPSTACRKFASFFLYPGCSVWIPYGCLPVVLGIPSDIMPEKESGERKPKSKALEVEDHPCVVGLSLCFNACGISAFPEINVAVKSLWVQATPHLYRNLKSNKTIEKWLADLVPEDAVLDDDGLYI